MKTLMIVSHPRVRKAGGRVVKYISSCKGASPQIQKFPKFSHLLHKTPFQPRSFTEARVVLQYCRPKCDDIISSLSNTKGRSGGRPQPYLVSESSPPCYSSPQHLCKTGLISEVDCTAFRAQPLHPCGNDSVHDVSVPLALILPPHLTWSHHLCCTLRAYLANRISFAVPG